MLGKTNVLALQEGSIITEIKDFSWLKMIVEVYGNFVKAIYNDNYLAAITADGSVVYSMDGEVWNISTPEFENCKLNDIEWDGTKFILVGSQTKTIESFTGEYGLVITTVDFVTYEEIKINNESNVLTGTSSNLYYDIEYVAVLFNNGKYTIAAVRHNGSYIKIHFYIGNLTDFQMSKEHISIDSGQTTAYSLGSVEDRGVMFVGPGVDVYEGMIVGEHSRDNDLTVNVTKGKQMTNTRSSSKDSTVVLKRPRQFNLESCLDYINEDELVEVTPENIRLRKRYLTENERRQQYRKNNA